MSDRCDQTKAKREKKKLRINNDADVEGKKHKKINVENCRSLNDNGKTIKKTDLVEYFMLHESTTDKLSCEQFRAHVTRHASNQRKL